VNQFAEQLFALRRKRRLLQKQVAARAGIDGSYLAGLERGRRDAPTPEVLERLLVALEASEAEGRSLKHALLVLRIEKLLASAQDHLEGGDVLVRLAEQLPRLEAEDVHLLEAFVSLLARAGRAREVAMK
jgi:transcriptional regulator with XRE-family HTH domain